MDGNLSDIVAQRLKIKIGKLGLSLEMVPIKLFSQTKENLEIKLAYAKEVLYSRYIA